MRPSTLLFCIGIATFSICHETAGFLVAADDRKCKYMRVEKMLRARCYDMNLKDVPQFLTTSIEMLDLAYNRIKKLKTVSFERYSSLRYLLLYENMIQTIEPGTFSQLTALEEIDLSNNALTTIPLEILNLPSLRNLYVDSNELTNLHSDLEKIEKPIKAPLEYINIADCGLNDIPHFGILPRLWHLNASVNSLHRISVEKFSALCHLRSIDLKDTVIPYCSCQLMQQFFVMQGVKLSYDLICDISNEGSCPNITIQTIFDEEYESCTSTIVSEKTRNSWYIIAGGVAAFLLIFIVILYYFQVRKTTKPKKKEVSTMQQLMNPS